MSLSSITRRARAARPLIAFALLAAIASCGDSSSLGIAQSWTLQTVDGEPLPFTVPGTTDDIVITSATANIGSDGGYTMTYTGTTDGVAGTVVIDRGVWTISHSTFNFVSSVLDNHQTYIAAYLTSTFNAAVPGALFGSTTQTFNMVYGVASAAQVP